MEILLITLKLFAGVSVMFFLGWVIGQILKLDDYRIRRNDYVNRIIKREGPDPGKPGSYITQNKTGDHHRKNKSIQKSIFILFVYQCAGT